jgi:hypothetical protein
LNGQDLKNAIEEIKHGLVDADLGGGVLKKRVARQGQGKRSGYRVIIATRYEEHWFFILGFPKNERSNMTKKEEESLKLMAHELLSYTQAQIEQAKKAGSLIEIP